MMYFSLSHLYLSLSRYLYFLLNIENCDSTPYHAHEFEGMDVSILPGSLMKVGIGNYLSREAAKQDLAQIQSSINQHAWIYAY